MLASLNQNIQFTSEREGHVIPFLDVTILHSDDGSLSIKVYCKPIHMDQYLQFSSHHPTAHTWAVVSTFHLTQESCFTLFYKVWYERRGYMWRRPSIRMPTLSMSSLLSAHHQGRTERRRMILDSMLPFHTQGVSEALTRILLDIDVQVHMKPSGHLGEVSPIQRTIFLMMTSPALCTRSIVVTVMPAM